MLAAADCVLVALAEALVDGLVDALDVALVLPARWADVRLSRASGWRSRKPEGRASPYPVYPTPGPCRTLQAWGWVVGWRSRCRACPHRRPRCRRQGPSREEARSRGVPLCHSAN